MQGAPARAHTHTRSVHTWYSSSMQQGTLNPHTHSPSPPPLHTQGAHLVQLQHVAGHVERVLARVAVDDLQPGE